MPHRETSPVSRVREIRMHGLKGGPAPLPLDNQRQKGRIYQWARRWERRVSGGGPSRLRGGLQRERTPGLRMAFGHGFAGDPTLADRATRAMASRVLPWWDRS
jgi:hypothetical protein